MKSSKKLIALICSLAMIFSVFANFTIVSAEDAPGMVLELDQDESTDTKKVVNVKYVGMPDGVSSFTVEVPVPEGTTKVTASSTLVDTISGAAATLIPNFKKEEGKFKLVGSLLTNAKSDDNVFATLTIELENPLTDDFTMQLLETSGLADEMAHEYYINMGSMTTADVVIAAPEATDAPATPIPDAPEITDRGIQLVVDADASTATEKIIKAKYVGMPDGVSSFTVEIDLPKGTTNVTASSTLVDTISGAAATLIPNFKKDEGKFKLVGSLLTNAKSDDNVFATIKITLSEDVTEDTVINLLETSGFADEMAHEYYINMGSMNTTYAVLRAPQATDAPATDAPATDAPATQDPSATTEPTKVPADQRPTPIPATDAPATDEPSTTDAPSETAIPDAPEITERGIQLVVDAEASTATEKVINAKYVGMPDGVSSFTIEIDLPKGTTNVTASSTLVDTISGAAATLIPNFKKDEGKFKLVGSLLTNAKSDNNVFATIKITLSEDITEDTVINLLETSGFADEMAHEYYINMGSMDTTYAVLRAPKATDAPATASPEPTEAPTPVPELGKVELDKLVSADKAAEAEKAEKTTYVTLTVTKADGTPAVYGVDFVAKDGDKVLTEEEFYNTIWGYNESVKPSEAISKYDIVAYTPDLNVSAKLNVVGEDEALDNGSSVVAPSATAEPTTKPTAAPDPNGVVFSGWSTGTVSVSKSTSKQAVATFDKIPEGAKDLDITFYVDDDSLIKIVSTSSTTTTRNQAKATVKVQAKKSVRDTAYVSAELTYTYEGKTYSVESTKDLTVKTTTSSSSTSSSGSYSGGVTGGVIAGANTSGPTLGQLNPTGQVYFQDLDQAPWAEDAITYLAQCGIVNGRSTTAFEPMGEITRAEFAKLVVTIYHINVGEGIQANVYPDVVGGDWYTPYVNAAAQYGIVTGYPDGLFRPNALVSRQEMAVMMYRAITTFGTQLPTVNEPKAWSDEIPAWSADAINALQVAGVMNGVSATEFGATDASTRAMAAQMIYNLYSVVVN